VHKHTSAPVRTYGIYFYDTLGYFEKFSFAASHPTNIHIFIKSKGNERGRRVVGLFQIKKQKCRKNLLKS
jgi:hypothetical protein